MQSNIELKAQTRTTGKGHSKAYRVDRTIPAVAYGPNMKGNLNISITQNDAVKYTGSKSYENAVFNLISDDSDINGLNVIVKDVSKSKTTHLPLHIDFYAPDMTKTIKVNVELKFTGKSAGVKDGGIFNVIRREVEIECLPADIPESFDIDVTTMAINDALHVSDLGIDAKYNLLTDDKITVANITVVEEEAVVPVAAAVPAEGETPEAAAAPDAAGTADKK